MTLMIYCHDCGFWYDDWIEETVWFGDMHVDWTPPVLAEDVTGDPFKFVMGSELDEYMLSTVIPDLMVKGRVFTNENQTGDFNLLAGYYDYMVGQYAEDDIAYGVLIAKDDFQDSDHDPGRFLHKQMALDMVDCNDNLICTDYFVENMFYVDRYPLAAYEYHNESGSYHEWPTLGCGEFPSDGYASGEYSVWILGIPLEYYATYKKMKVRIKDDVDNWARFEVYDYEDVDVELWIDPPEDDEVYCETDLVTFEANIQPDIFKPLLPYVSWLPVDEFGVERLPYSQDPENGYQSGIQTPFVGDHFEITLNDLDFWVVAGLSYCSGGPNESYESDPKHVQLMTCERYAQLANASRFQRTGQSAGNVGIEWSHEALFERQYVNQHKMDPPDGCSPVMNSRKICLEVKLTGDDWCNLEYFVIFSYEDPPLQPQGRAFPWLDPEPLPHDWDNLGDFDVGGARIAGFGSVQTPEETATVQFEGETAKTDFYTSTFGGDNYRFYAALFCGTPEAPTPTGIGITEDTVVEVWRFVSVEICYMAAKSGGIYPPDFIPNHEFVEEAYAESYIEMNIYDLFQDMDNDPSTLLKAASCSMLFETMDLEGTDWDYVDDFPPDGPDICDFSDEEVYLNPRFHSSFTECRDPSHTIQVIGFDKYLDHDIFGWNFPGNQYRDVHVHTFIAKRAIYTELVSLGKVEELVRATNKTLIHELGHLLVYLLDNTPSTPNDPHVMMQGYSYVEIPLKFHGTHVKILREGNNWFEDGNHYCADCY